jgi:hypothetical protein
MTTSKRVAYNMILAWNLASGKLDGKGCVGHGI